MTLAPKACSTRARSSKGKRTETDINGVNGAGPSSGVDSAPDVSVDPDNRELNTEAEKEKSQHKQRVVEPTPVSRTTTDFSPQPAQPTAASGPPRRDTKVILVAHIYGGEREVDSIVQLIDIEQPIPFHFLQTQIRVKARLWASQHNKIMQYARCKAIVAADMRVISMLLVKDEDWAAVMSTIVSWRDLKATYVDLKVHAYFTVENAPTPLPRPTTLAAPPAASGSPKRKEIPNPLASERPAKSIRFEGPQFIPPATITTTTSTTTTPTPTNQLAITPLPENKTPIATIRQRIQNQWPCDGIATCANFPTKDAICWKWLDGSHIPINSGDLQTWADEIDRGITTIYQPSNTLLARWSQKGHHQLVVGTNPHNAQPQRIRTAFDMGSHAGLVFDAYFQWLTQKRPCRATLIQEAKHILLREGYEYDQLRDLSMEDASLLDIGLGIRSMIREDRRDRDWVRRLERILAA
ncbi:hypothetical protein AJ80_00619 [Polytolypa hystricis UAMH7299]|uniref:Uncharacterized protein n=1 Tax=Polytolypa hystricis (strain UAMH7299) TaxID=1447883 RepID=A0A2B7Z102_POLH7|nr:hypothetical protein AJ80_00619 [Polytolypa hystricis UAMH7299]